MQRITYLDGLRGVLASIVALSHIYGAITSYGPERPWRGAALAVDCFFVMSGFVLAYTIERNVGDFQKYFLKRVFRLWPVHVFALFWTIVVVAHNYIHGGYVPKWFPFEDGWGLLANIFAVTNIWRPNHEVFNDPSWSVSVELFVSTLMLHYLVSNRLKLLALMVSLSAYGYLFYFDGFRLQSWSAVGIGINGGLLRGIGGILIGYFLYAQQWSLKANPWVGWGLSAVLGIILYVSDGKLDILGLVVFIVLLCCLRCGTGLSDLVANPAFVWLGEISYSLYLMHTPVILLMAPGAWGKYFGPFTAFVIFLLAVIVSAVVAFGFEKPIRARLYSHLK